MFIQFDEFLTIKIWNFVYIYLIQRIFDKQNV